MKILENVATYYFNSRFFNVSNPKTAVTYAAANSATQAIVQLVGSVALYSYQKRLEKYTVSFKQVLVAGGLAGIVSTAAGVFAGYALTRVIGIPISLKEIAILHVIDVVETYVLNAKINREENLTRRDSNGSSLPYSGLIVALPHAGLSLKLPYGVSCAQ